MCGLTMRITAMPTPSPPAMPSSIFQRLGTSSRLGALAPSGAMPGIGGMVSSGVVSAASMASLSLICRPPAAGARGSARRGHLLGGVAVHHHAGLALDHGFGSAAGAAGDHRQARERSRGEDDAEALHLEAAPTRATGRGEEV